MSAEVVTLGGESHADPLDNVSVSKMLRALADKIDAGEHGNVLRGVVVLRSSGLEPIVFGHGRTDPVQSFMDLHAGAQQLMFMKSPSRR